MKVNIMLLSVALCLILPIALPAQTVSDDSVKVQSDILPTPADSLGVSSPKEDSAKIAADELARLMTLDTLFGKFLDEIEGLKGKIDSLEKVNNRLATTAARRLTLEVFKDSFRKQRFNTCIVDPKKRSIQLVNRMGKRQVHTFNSVAELAKRRNQTLLLAMNAGMYEKNRLAKGLLIEKGKTIKKLDVATKGYGNFYLQPNGVFALDTANRAYVETTQAYMVLADTAQIAYATQSGPMMVIDGEINPLFNDGSPNRNIRNAVGVTASNEVVFAISQREVTFFEMASFMIKHGCVNALYLDGAISKAYMPKLKVGSLNSGNHLGPLIMITE